MSNIIEYAKQLEKTFSLLSTDSDPWPCYLEFVDAHRNERLDSDVPNENLGELVADHLARMAAMKLYRRRAGRRHTKNLGLVMHVPEFRLTGFGQWVFNRSKQKRTLIFCILTYLFWAIHRIKSYRWFITFGAFGTAAVNAAKFYNMAFHELGHVAVTLVAGFVIVVFSFLVRRLFTSPD